MAGDSCCRATLHVNGGGLALIIIVNGLITIEIRSIFRVPPRVPYVEILSTFSCINPDLLGLTHCNILFLYDTFQYGTAFAYSLVAYYASLIGGCGGIARKPDPEWVCATNNEVKLGPVRNIEVLGVAPA